MHTPELSLIGKLDNGLNKGLGLMLGAFKTGFIWLSGLFMIALLPVLIFEYGDGLADLSRIEWIFMVLMALLIWRHVGYCKHFGTGFLRGFNRLLMCQGLLATVQLVVIGLVASVLVGTQQVDTASDHLREFMLALMMDDPVSKILGFGLILFATYLAAPSSHRLPRTEPQAEPQLPPTTHASSPITEPRV